MFKIHFKHMKSRFCCKKHLFHLSNKYYVKILSDLLTIIVSHYAKKHKEIKYATFSTKPLQKLLNILDMAKGL